MRRFSNIRPSAKLVCQQEQGRAGTPFSIFTLYTHTLLCHGHTGFPVSLSVVYKLLHLLTLPSLFVFGLLPLIPMNCPLLRRAVSHVLLEIPFVCAGDQTRMMNDDYDRVDTELAVHQTD